MRCGKKEDNKTWVLLVFRGDLELCLSMQSEWFTWLNVWHWLNILFKLSPTNYFSLFFCAFLALPPPPQIPLSLSVPLWMRGSVTTGSVYKVQRLIMAVERSLYIKITFFSSLLFDTNHIKHTHKHITYQTRLYATSRPSKTMQSIV